MSEKLSISISIIGHNEAQNLPQCFESLNWADEIVFVDCESDDNSIRVLVSSKLHLPGFFISIRTKQSRKKRLIGSWKN
jgi:glycosyltransferase involved in cell wall biosynthesis